MFVISTTDNKKSLKTNNKTKKDNDNTKNMPKYHVRWSET